jgi:hypothetical protein
MILEGIYSRTIIDDGLIAQLTPPVTGGVK